MTKTVTSLVAVAVTVSGPLRARGASVRVGMVKSAMVELAGGAGLGGGRLHVVVQEGQGSEDCESDWIDVVSG